MVRAKATASVRCRWAGRCRASWWRDLGWHATWGELDGLAKLALMPPDRIWPDLRCCLQVIFKLNYEDADDITVDGEPRVVAWAFPGKGGTEEAVAWPAPWNENPRKRQFYATIHRVDESVWGVITLADVRPPPPHLLRL